MNENLAFWRLPILGFLAIPICVSLPDWPGLRIAFVIAIAITAALAIGHTAMILCHTFGLFVDRSDEMDRIARSVLMRNVEHRRLMKLLLVTDATYLACATICIFVLSR
ncbi:hypothetical protein CA13_00460 [Planctomycetes bacterium CA13]|uniref:Uncharacterized protein n=1 Tax=Novipirellula herctigrandis TaxID=2527986 RepID=A0A5C5YUZ7_9BACT|nr:hypothetical protein CA13_00460 [Planctomycetes bacterium CA13]